MQASPCLLCFEVFHYGEGLPLLSIFPSVFAIDTSRRKKEKYSQEQGPTGRGFWLRDGTGRVLAKKVGYRDGSGRVVRKFWRQKAHIWEINVRQIIINSRTPKIQTALAWVLDEQERDQEKENHLNTISKIMGTLVHLQLYTFSYRKAVIRPQNMSKTADWG